MDVPLQVTDQVLMEDLVAEVVNIEELLLQEQDLEVLVILLLLVHLKELMVQQETPVQVIQMELEAVVEQQLQEQQENQVVVDVVVLVQQQVLMEVQ